MTEKLRKPKLGPPSKPVADDTDAVVKQSAANVDVIHGVYAHSLPLAGMAVKLARMELSNKMNIDPTAVAVVNGTEVSDDTVLTENSTLTFVKPSGEKGVSPYVVRTYDDC